MTATTDDGTQIGFGRTQPEFSLGERMATMEADQKNAGITRKHDEAHRKEIAKLEAKLQNQKLAGVKQEMDTKDKARQEAITKAEKAASERAAALATELRQLNDQSQTRLGALERGDAGLTGEKGAIIALQNRQIALVGVIATVLAVIITYHP